MARALAPVHHWVCWSCNTTGTGDTRPQCAEHGAMADLGYRVGEAPANYAWYSTAERAMTDRRTTR